MALQTVLNIYFLDSHESDCSIIEVKTWDTDQVSTEPVPKNKGTIDLKYCAMIVDGGDPLFHDEQRVNQFCSEVLGWEPGRHFDYMLLTHFHDDHASGFVVQNIRAKHVIDPGWGSTFARTKMVKPIVQRNNGTSNQYCPYIQEMIINTKGTWTVPPFVNSVENCASTKENTPVIDETGSVKFHWLCGGGYLADIGKKKSSLVKTAKTNDKEKQWLEQIGENEFSLGFAIEFNEFIYYSAGDAGAVEKGKFSALERMIFERLYDEKTAPEWMKLNGKFRAINVMKNSHHGGENSVAKKGSEYWIKTIKPETIITTYFSSGLFHKEFLTSLSTIKDAKERNLSVYFWNKFSKYYTTTETDCFIKIEKNYNTNILIKYDSVRQKYVTNYYYKKVKKEKENRVEEKYKSKKRKKEYPKETDEFQTMQVVPEFIKISTMGKKHTTSPQSGVVNEMITIKYKSIFTEEVHYVQKELDVVSQSTSGGSPKKKRAKDNDLSLDIFYPNKTLPITIKENYTIYFENRYPTEFIKKPTGNDLPCEYFPVELLSIYDAVARFLWVRNHLKSVTGDEKKMEKAGQMLQFFNSDIPIEAYFPEPIQQMDAAKKTLTETTKIIAQEIITGIWRLESPASNRLKAIKIPESSNDMESVINLMAAHPITRVALLQAFSSKNYTKKACAALFDAQDDYVKKNQISASTTESDKIFSENLFYGLG